ncbi:hypothetical protein TGAMA5MH_02221 [Trichoderma gamsii]|uniref:Uncharacterized protein n=1 Tax=Trichoderma gamsii TaxID=398673 RepID=A0A2K0TKY4_9HYPO|nr:hypothetical protein TGAMA5MH_02221 [Trichoderma gamsii]
MDALIEVIGSDRAAYNQCIQSIRENLISIDLALGRLEAPDTDLT